MTTPMAAPTPARPVLATSLALLVAWGPADGIAAQVPEGADAFLAEGQYEEAIDLLEQALARQPSNEVAVALADLLLDVGRYEQAESVLRDRVSADPADQDVRLYLGRSLMALGRLDEADRAFAAASGPRGGAALLARVHQGEILLRRGEQAAAYAVFDAFIDIYNQSPDLDSRELLAVAMAVRHMGVISPVLYQDALRAYDEALALDPANIEAHLGIGYMFLERFNGPEARAALEGVLRLRDRHPEALLGIALALELEGTETDQVGPLVEDALAVNPNLVGALVLRARSALRSEDGPGAEADLNAALDVNPTSGEALAVLAAAHFIRGLTDDYEEVRERALAINPRDSQFFVTVADIASQVRYYQEAEALAMEGVALDSLGWNAYGVLGLNQLRLGKMAEGRENLEIAFEGDPYNPWIKNNLDLLDYMDAFEEWPSESVNLYMHPEDGGALAIYMAEIAERAFDTFSERYRFTPQTPVRIETFRRSADFSVRTMGLTGLGALGVAFGPVVAMDSPAARGPGGYEWASTLWHELAHVFHLGLTEHRMPRWLSEGLAVHEERLGGRGWGMRPSFPFLAAYVETRLRPPSQLSESFVNPRFPDEIGFAYILSSLVAQWIEDEHGFDAILDMMEAYGEGRGPQDVTRRVLRMDLEEMDEEFDAWFRERYSGPLASAQVALDLRALPPDQRPSDRETLEQRVASAPLDLESRIALGRVLIGEEEYEASIQPLTEARDLFPENPDPQGPNRMLAEVYMEIENDSMAEAALEEHLRWVTGDYEGFVTLADIREEHGDAAGAAEALKEAMWVYPFEVPVHDRLATLYGEIGDSEGEVRERRVALALEPADRAGALHSLADAQFRAGDLDDARRTVFEALELAPRFPEAQDLLLRIMGSGGNE